MAGMAPNGADSSGPLVDRSPGFDRHRFEGPLAFFFFQQSKHPLLGFSHRTTPPLRGLFEVLTPFDLFGEALFLAELLESAQHLLH